MIDACVHNHWASQPEVMQYMDPGWREYLARPKNLPGGAMLRMTPMLPYQNPNGDKRLDAYPEVGEAGSSPDLLRRAVLANGVDRAVLSFDMGLLMSTLPNHYLGRAVVRAANDWMIERWLTSDEGFYGLLLVPNQLPDDAAQEVRRVGEHPRIVGVALGGSGLGRPFGHPAYHPLLEAAADLNLAVVVHAGTDAAPDTLSSTAAGGVPTTYTEYRVLAAQPVMTHIVSMIGQGVFEKYPNLRVLASGAGAAWVPSLMWRFDTNYRGLRREVPWVRRLPSEYFREHVRVTTYPFRRGADVGRYADFMRSFGQPESFLCYASGYPNWDSDTADDVAPHLPEEWHSKVFHDNALGLFRWPDRPTGPVVRTRSEDVGVMPEEVPV
jgi:predicted TIM-barrel fold metal-dependent hydrolase